MRPMNLDGLVSALRELDASLRRHVASTANVALTTRNWLVGAYLVEFEQSGEDRARYGENLVPEIAAKLAIKGLGAVNLAASRNLYFAYPEIFQTVSENSELARVLESPILQTLSERSFRQDRENSQPKAHVSTPQKSSRPDFALPVPILMRSLSFSHFVELLRLDDPLKRAFYESESVRGTWSVRELKRQIGSLLFERTGLSTDKEKLLRLAHSDARQLKPADIIRDPYIFEFLGLKPHEALCESAFEEALLNDLQSFLLELGHGFCFEDRQKRIRIGSTDYFIDLVFYHRRLHCHILIELKVEPFTHGNAGQLNTYLNYYRRHEMHDGDNPPIGLLLCTDKDHALVEYALGGMDENLFVSAYRVALPEVAELEAFLRTELSKL
jgi:predicted nuclease of restriction endonuclease-like (RecB) superfamily